MKILLRSYQQSAWSNYREHQKRGVKRKLQCGVSKSNEFTLFGTEHIILITYFVILDNLQLSWLQKRKFSYYNLAKIKCISFTI